jgi:hypothetical protein
MGGQACVFYGAAEFSRDCDIVILLDADNLARLSSAIAALHAECIALPEFKPEYLTRGHAIHFRCRHSEAKNIRLDVMSTLRGCDAFEILWQRRTSIQDPHSEFNFGSANCVRPNYCGKLPSPTKNRYMVCPSSDPGSPARIAKIWLTSSSTSLWRKRRNVNWTKHIGGR